MRKLFFGSIIAGMLAAFNPTIAQEVKDTTETTMVDSTSTDSSTAIKEEKPEKPVEEEAEVESMSFNQVIKQKMSEGGLTFMSIVLVCLIIGLIIAVERIITLTTLTTNTRKLMTDVKTRLLNGGVLEAKEYCARTKGPVAAIFAQGLVRSEQGLDAVQTSVENYGASEIGKLEKGMTWISLFIALAPMFGFMGTVIGMIDAFDSIQGAGEIKISEVAGGIKTALLTTVAGLIVAVILQFFYNYIVSKIDAITGQMEDASNEFIDLLIVSKTLNK